MEPQQPVTRLDDLDVAVVRTPAGMRVEVTDPRCGLKLMVLDPEDAAALAGLLVARSARAGWESGRDPGE